MKKALLFHVFLLLTLIFIGCKRDKDEEPAPTSYFIEYGGNKYVFLEGVIWDYGEGSYRPEHYTYAYHLPRPVVYTYDGNFTVSDNNPPITITFFLSTPDSEVFKEGTYEFIAEFNNWLDEELYEKYLASIKGKYMLSNVLIGFDENGDNIIEKDEQFGVDKGTVKVVQDHLEFDLSLTNGKTVKGRSNPSLSTTFPPA